VIKEPDIRLFNDDCVDIIKGINKSSINLVITDLPYGTTACKWDSIIDLEIMWKELNRICLKNAAMIFTSQQPFTWKLASSNPKEFRYELIWQKPNGTNPYAAKIMPMKRHENILIFYNKKPVYNPQMTEGKAYTWDSTRSKGEAGSVKQSKKTPINNTGTRYPTSVLNFPQERGLHPTQKPISLMEWLILTYSNKNQIVLDLTMGSGTTGVAAINTNRSFIGIEKNKKYFDIAVERIKESINEQSG
jgi:site-specific DNA-methyltransferase (adenine-specific)